MSAGTKTAKVSVWRQPAQVWAVAFACVIAFMGIGLVDPILPEISQSLHASPGQTELLFTTYLFVTALVMFLTSWVASRIGRKWTLLLGLGLVVAFSAGCAAAGSVDMVIGFRGGWGVGNALFVSTALATVLGASADPRRAIMLYEGALGAGMALGPLVGGLLGNISWRGPFTGTAVLMGIGLVAIAIFVPRTRPAAGPASLSAPFRALADRRMRLLMVAAVLYNYGYFTLLAYGPFPIAEAARRAGTTSPRSIWASSSSGGACCWPPGRSGAPRNSPDSSACAAPSSPGWPPWRCSSSSWRSSSCPGCKSSSSSSAATSSASSTPP